MSVEFDISRLVPKFIYKDKNGYALCRAIQAGFEYLAEKAEEGIAIIQDVDQMPEWRLDELAEEYNILYDYSADVEVKREWIKNAPRFSALRGTAAGIVQYLKAKFGNATVEEAWQYGGDPYHFQVTVTGEYNEENDDWAYQAIEAAKNVRSVLDDIVFNSGNAEASLYVAAGICGIEIVDKATVL